MPMTRLKPSSTRLSPQSVCLTIKGGREPSSEETRLLPPRPVMNPPNPALRCNRLGHFRYPPSKRHRSKSKPEEAPGVHSERIPGELESGRCRDGCDRGCDRGCDKSCMKHPHHDHPLFVNHWGSSSTPLAIPAALLLLIFNCIPHATIHRLLHVNHKAIEDMSKRLGQLRESWVVTTEKKIQLGTGEKWADAEADEVEADEATFDKTSVNGKLHWEQWCGILQRGRPHTLVLHRLKPLASKLRAPGPAVRKVEWKPLAAKWLQDRQVILHTDSAKRYASKVSSVLHDRIVHKKSGSRSTGSSSGWPDLCPDPDAQDPWH